MVLIIWETSLFFILYCCCCYERKQFLIFAYLKKQTQAMGVFIVISFKNFFLLHIFIFKATKCNHNKFLAQFHPCDRKHIFIQTADSQDTLSFWCFQLSRLFFWWLDAAFQSKQIIKMVTSTLSFLFLNSVNCVLSPCLRQKDRQTQELAFFHN